MDAVEFCKTVNRLCRNHDCNVCPVKEKWRCMVVFDDTSIRNIKETISKVEKWVKEHPANTRQSEFLKRFPNADLTRLQPCMIEKDKRPMWCGKYADFGANGCCDECRYAYWNEEVDN